MIIETKKSREIVDITKNLNDLIGKQKIKGGLCHLFVAHTTCAVATADLDPGTDLDMLDAFSAMVPSVKWRHPHNPVHTGDHVMASLIGPSLTIPIKGGKLSLGTWQRVILVEFSGPRKREVQVFFSD